MFEIRFTSDAVSDLRVFRKAEQQTILAQINDQLLYQPTLDTRHRKRLRPNRVAEYELRIGSFRVFYDVDENANIVKIEAVGCKKGSRLFIRGKEYVL